MKEIALAGQVSRVLGDIIGALRAAGLSVNAIVDNPERIMLDDTELTISHLDLSDHDVLTGQFDGYHDVVLAFDDNQMNKGHNDFALKEYNKLVNAVRDAGVSRLIVVGSPEAEAYFTGDLKRRKEEKTDWVFISTENDYPRRVASEIIRPSRHRETYIED